MEGRKERKREDWDGGRERGREREGRGGGRERRVERESNSKLEVHVHVQPYMV